MTAPGATPVGRAATGMGLAAAASRALGGVRVLFVAAVLGTTVLGDTFEGANTVPTVIFELLAAGALSAVLVPTFVELFERGDTEEAERQAGALLGLTLMVLGSLAVLGMVLAPVLADLLTAAAPDSADGAARNELTTNLLRWFLPQLLLYPVGFLAIALLNARRVFALPAAAPIANTVVVVVGLSIFRAVVGPDGGVALSAGEQAILGLTGTLGVAAFVAVPLIALWRDGVKLRPRRGITDPSVRRLLGLSGWAVLQHTGGALLLGSAIVLGAAVEGGVISYRVAFYIFLAPYGILAQPIHTTIHTELSTQVDDGDEPELGRSLRWGLDSLALVVLPVSALLVALARPAVSVVTFGRADSGDGVDLIAAGTAGLALGLFGYGAFRLLAGAWYAKDDSRTPAAVALSTALIAVTAMALVVPATSGAATIAVLGIGHSAAFTVGAVILAVRLGRRWPVDLVPRQLLPALGLSVVLGGLAWLAVEGVAPDGRGPTALVVVAIAAVGLAAYGAAVHALGLRPEPVAVAG